MEAIRGRLGVQIALGLAVLAVLGLAGGYGVAQRARPEPVRVSVEQEPAEPSSESSMLVVHVAGAVERPGVYRLAHGSRIDDAVRAAGGPRPDAVLDAINLAAPVQDGEQIVVPLEGEEGAVSPPADAGGGLINLNTADAAGLQELPGIGPALAERIIAHREGHGPFETVRDLLKVSGIGPRKFEQLEGLVTV